MDTQNTPVHIKLWHKDFWRLCFANLLLMSSVYMLVFAIPYFLIQEKYQMWQIGCVLLAYGLGLFLFGGFCSYLVQRYRRNMVCQLSILGVVVCLSVLYYLDTSWATALTSSGIT
jgi:predicted MFS family arabinose efflux permease